MCSSSLSNPTHAVCMWWGLDVRLTSVRMKGAAGHRAAGEDWEQRGYVLGLDAGFSSLWTPKEYLTVQEFKSNLF